MCWMNTSQLLAEVVIFFFSREFSLAQGPNQPSIKWTEVLSLCSYPSIINTVPKFN